MRCSEFDLEGYFLEELAEDEREIVEAHLPACEGCREELERLRLTGAALMSVRDEEIPRRIAFVSDKVFEPSRWQRFWQSGARLGFAGAAMLSVAILVHGLSRPAPVAVDPGLDVAAVQQIVEREVAQRLETAVAQAVAGVQQLDQAETARLLEAAEERYEMQRQADMMAVSDSFEYLRKQLNVRYIASAYPGEQP